AVTWVSRGAIATAAERGCAEELTVPMPAAAADTRRAPELPAAVLFLPDLHDTDLGVGDLALQFGLRDPKMPNDCGVANYLHRHVGKLERLDGCLPPHGPLYELDRRLTEEVLTVMLSAPPDVAASAVRGVLEFDSPAAAALCTA